MNIRLVSAGLALSLLAVLPAHAAAPTTPKEKYSYALGVDIANNFHSSGVTSDMLDIKSVAQAIDDVLSGKKPQLSDAEIQEGFKALQAELIKTRAAQGEKAKKAGADYLAKYAKEKGVVTTKSGIGYKVITAGKGAKPKATDVVKVNYKGTLIDGTEFDSSYKRGEPATFPANRVIEGWQEVLQLMPIGSKWEVVIPSDLAYGEHGGGQIGPNETLKFEIELLGIENNPHAGAQKPAGHPGAPK